MSNALLVRKIVEKLAKEVHDWNIKSSNMHPSDADGWIGFRKDIPESDKIGDHVTYLNHWDADNTGYMEEDDIQRDNGVGLARIVMQQVTPIKS